MKKILLSILLVLSILAVKAENNEQALETVHLDMSEEVTNIQKESNLINNDKLEFSTPTKIETFDTNINQTEEDLYKKKTSSYKKEKQLNEKSTVGAQYDTTIAPESLTQTRTLYSKYNMTDKMSVSTSYKNNSTDGLAEQTKGTVSVVPEYRINKHVLLRNLLGRNIQDKSNKSELQLQVQPFNDDRMNVNLGAGQVQRDNSGNTSSQVNFGTNFKF